MRDKYSVLFGVVIALAGIWALWETRGWPIQAWLYPRVVLVPLVALAIAESLAALRGPQSRGREMPTDFALESTVDPSLALRRTLLTAAWILGFFLAVIVAGFQAAVPLFVLAYLRNSRERWWLSIALAGAAALAFHSLFVSLLHLPLPPGLLWRVFGQ